jgi:diguanylate cyclase (GGDEF)-like protein
MTTPQQFRTLLFWLALGYAGLALVLAWQLKRAHDLTLERASDHAGNLVQILDGQLSSNLRRIEASLHHIADRVPRAALHREAMNRYGRELNPMLHSYRDNFPELSNFFVWDGEGRVLYSTAPMYGPFRDRDISERPGFRTLRDNPKAKIAFSELLRGMVTNDPSIFVYVPIRDASGRLLGLVTASLNIEYTRQWFQGMNLTPRSLLFVRNSQDHKLVLRHPWGGDVGFNQPVRNRLQERIDAGETAGRDRFTAVSDGTPRVYAFRKLDGYPFYVVVGMSEHDALESWRNEALFVAFIVVVLAVLLGLLLLRMHAIQRQRTAARRRADEALALLRDALDSIAVGIVIYDEQDRLVLANRAMRALYNELEDALVQPGANFQSLLRLALERGLFPEAVGREEAWLAARVQARRTGQGLGVAHEHRLGDGRWVQYSEHRTPAGYIVGSRIDITELKKLEAELREQASTDALTGLANRRHFMQSLDSEMERVRRRTTARACVLMLDLDHFKRVNDQYGHAAGDGLLRHFAELLRGELRGTDMAGRLGGEEFAVILPGASLDEARAWAQRLCDAVAAQPLAWGEQTIRATVSVGVSVLSPDDSAGEIALMRADGALYRAKEAGRNRVETADKV